MKRTGTLNILQVNTSDRGGGAERSAFALFEEYRARGYTSWLAVGRKTGNDPDVFQIPRNSRQFAQFYRSKRGMNAALAGARAAVQYAPARARREVDGWAGLERFTHPGSRLLLELTPERPQIVHLHNLHPNYFDLRYLPELSHELPVILNLRDMWTLTGHCAYTRGCERWKTGCGECPHLDTYPAVRRDATAFNWRRKKKIFEKSRLHITAPSQWLLDRVRESMLAGVESRVIPNGIDLGVFRPGEKAKARAALGLPLDAAVVVYVPNSPFKNAALMQTALRQVQSNGKRPLIFIGIGRWAGAEETLGAGKHIAPGIITDLGEMGRYFQAADIHLHASVGEIFGRTLIEAMACGTPTVAAAVEAVPEVVVDGVTGLLAPAGDAAALAAGINQLLADDETRKRMGEAGVRVSRERYGLDRQVQSFLDWYKELVEREHER